MHRWFALCLLAMSHIALAGAQEQWMTVLADGRKVGSAHVTRSVTDDAVITRQELRMQLDRAGTLVEIANTEVHTETLDGKPRAFVATTTSGAQHESIEGRIRADGMLEITREVAGTRHLSVIAWPEGAVLAEGQARASRNALTKVGARVHFTSFDTRATQALEVTRVALGHEELALPDGSERLLKVEETTRLPVGETRSTIWLDAAGAVQRIRTEMAGVNFDMLACDAACANAPNESADVFRHALVELPRSFNRDEAQRTLRWRIRSRDGRPLRFATTDEQTVRQRGAASWELTIGRATAAQMGEPIDADLAASAWIEADHAEIIAAARNATTNLTEDHERMAALTRYVRGHIDAKNLGVGYATALETLRAGEGDCTEHAVLLAALARALGIPARIATGLAWAPAFAGRGNVLVPHAWVIARVGSRWQSFDAALAGFDATHIALDVGDGDPWRFYAALDTLGRITVSSVKPLRR